MSVAGRAARALARSGLDVVRVPEDLPILARHGFAEVATVGLNPLLRLGLLRRAAHGLYEVRDPRGVTRGSFEKLLAARFAGTPHLATGWWALARDGLTSQDVREVVVLTTTNRRDLTIAGRHVRVATVQPNTIWGSRTDANGLIVARAERAFCDCAATRPARIPAARIAEALDTYLRSTPHALVRLERAIKRTGSPVVARRLGYLTELVAGAHAAEPLHRLTGRSRKADALDPGDTHSPIVTRWQIRTSLVEDDLLEHRRVS